MHITEYDDIRPYFDEEIPAAMARASVDPLFAHFAGFVFPQMELKEARKKMRACRTIDEVQREIMYPAIMRIAEASIKEFTSDGVENLSQDKRYLFISNHRDITLDAFLLQVVLFGAGHQTSDISYGNNLLYPGFVTDICRSNKMTKIIRKEATTPREFLENSRHVSAYIRQRIAEGHSVWIAQRNGRTKNGIDQTDQGLLKMFGLSGVGDFVEDFDSLHIVPIAISYEYETCDVLKTIELVKRKSGEPYHKAEDEDFISVLTGIKQQKGHVHISICKPLTREDIESSVGETKAESYKNLTDLISRRIVDAYHLHATNYIAHDMLYGDGAYADKYTEEDRQIFEQRLAEAEEFLGALWPMARETYLGIYANPIDSKQR